MADDGLLVPVKVKVPVDDLIGEALNFAVAQAKGYDLKPLNDNRPDGQWVTVFGEREYEINAPIQNYCSSSILAIDLIKDMRLDVESPKNVDLMWAVRYFSAHDCNSQLQCSSNHFCLEVAVARCYVKSKRGEFAHVPHGLIGK